MRRIVASGTRDHRDTACDAAHGKCDRVDLLIVRHRCSLPRGSAYDKRVDPGLKLRIDDGAQGFVIDGAVSERRDKRGRGTFENRFFHGFLRLIFFHIYSMQSCENQTPAAVSRKKIS